MEETTINIEETIANFLSMESGTITIGLLEGLTEEHLFQVIAHVESNPSNFFFLTCDEVIENMSEDAKTAAQPYLINHE